VSKPLRQVDAIAPRRGCPAVAQSVAGSAPRMDPRDLREAFANNLRRRRHAKGISQEDLG